MHSCTSTCEAGSSGNREEGVFGTSSGLFLANSLIMLSTANTSCFSLAAAIVAEGTPRDSSGCVPCESMVY